MGSDTGQPPSPAAGALANPLLLFEDPLFELRARALLRRLPPLTGRSIAIRRAPGLRDRRGAVHAGSFVRQRLIALDCTRAEFPRVFVHELFHFAWVRLGNRARGAFEDLLRGELLAGARGELGWSAEWRKRELDASDLRRRSRRWREYCCESFCDTAAWVYSGVAQHEEFTLAGRFRGRRRGWFRNAIETGRLPL